ncbi:MAG: T9SS type A sorting domain-containing protein [Bacteroidota bacterium]
MFPNPVQTGNKVIIKNIEWMTKFNSVLIDILNIEGQALMSDKIPMGSSNVSLETDILIAGSYIIRFSGLTTSVKRKLIVL